jgi:hypothetical protein
LPMSCHLYWQPLFYRIFQPFTKFNADRLGHRQASIDYPNKTDFEISKF